VVALDVNLYVAADKLLSAFTPESVNRAFVQEARVKTAHAIKGHFASFRSEGASPESFGHLSFACAQG
jgi:hypothetical protein